MGSSLRCGCYHRYLCTEFGVRRCQFDTDYATANDQKAFGNFFKRQSACRIYAVCIFLYPGNGRHRGDGPAAMMILSNVMFSFVPSFFRTAEFILNAEGCCSSTTWILFAFIRPVTPPTSCAVMAFFFACTCFQSTFFTSIWMPYSAISFASVSASAACRIAFVGIQPTSEPVPPNLFFSISVTLPPSCAALIAAT